MKVIATTVSAQRKHNAFQGFKASKEPFVLPEEPLVLGYGAGRYAGSGDAGSMEQINEVSSLFNQVGELYHAETILSDLDYAATKSEGKGAAQERLQKLTEVLAAILPDIEDAAAIEIFPPSIPGTTQARAGVYFRTPYGSVRFSELGLGYQTMIAWVVDIAWRLFARYPTSGNPLAEPAIVLVDEIDLHLHPKWQRDVRSYLTKHFPNVQFIATAHSPLMAQSSLDANLAVLRREGDHVIIENNPVVVRNWRLDQVITSDLFEHLSPRPPETEALIKEHEKLLRKRRRSAAEETRLKEIDQELRTLQAPMDPEGQEAMDIIREAAKALKAQIGSR